MLSTLLGMFCFSLAFLLMTLASLLPFVPVGLRFVQHSLRAMLILSFRFYDLILPRLNRWTMNWGIDLLKGLPRIAATTSLSLTIGCVIAIFTPLPISGLILFLCITHGLFVGLTWDEIQKPGGFRLGVRIE